MATPELPEPMNSSPHHSKVNITTTLSDPTFLAGSFVSGKLNMECRADQGLGIGTLMVELFGIQGSLWLNGIHQYLNLGYLTEFSSRDRSATSTFLHSRRLFQGPGLPPSNAVQAHTMPGDPLLPEHYYQARRGKSTFLFRIPIPTSSPSSISFASGSAKVRYELRASADVYWKNEKTLVVDNRIVDVIQAHPHKDSLRGPPEAIVVGDNGKLWMQGRIIGGPVVAGGSACLELQVKNHSSKKVMTVFFFVLYHKADSCIELQLNSYPYTQSLPAWSTTTANYSTDLGHSNDRTIPRSRVYYPSGCGRCR